jgi:cytochrome c-type biogenesis protein CcmH/NrfG
MNLTKNMARLQAARLVFPLLVSVLVPAIPTRCQDGVSEVSAISGNNAVIIVTVRSNNGEPLGVPAVVKIYRNGMPNGQGTTSQGGRAIFTPQNLGEFTVVVEAPGYKTGRGEVSVPIPVKAEVDIYMQPEASSGDNAMGAGGPLLAPKAKEALDKALQALRDGKLEEAEKQLKEAMRLAPGHPDVLYLQGVLFLRQNKWPEAQKTLEKAAQVNPNNARTLAALGTALSNQGKYEEAIVPLEKSLQLNAGGWETHWTLAKAYYYNKRYDEALKTSQEALVESHGKAPEIELLVAQSLSAVGRYEDSAHALREFLKNHADHPEAATAKRWLERLNSAGKIRSN